MVDLGNAYNILVGRHKVKRALGGPRGRRENNIEMDVKAMMI